MQPAPRWYEELKTRMQTQNSDGAMKTIMFTGTNHGDGTSTTAAGFASSLARDYEFKVLLMDVNLRTPGLHKFFDMHQTHGFLDVFSNKNGFKSILSCATQGNLYVVICDGDFSEPARQFESDRFAELLKTIRGSFDYVIMDAPPVSIFLDALVVGRQVDGVILILESGKTRRQVALKAKTEIESAGGNFLGVVLNKRKYYIPKWLYKRL